jgi:hypothetical protein
MGDVTSSTLPYNQVIIGGAVVRRIRGQPACNFVVSLQVRDWMCAMQRLLMSISAAAILVGCAIAAPIASAGTVGMRPQQSTGYCSTPDYGTVTRCSINPAVTLIPGQTIRITLVSQGTPGIPWHFCIYNWYYCTDILDQEGMWFNWTNSTGQTISIDTLYAMTGNGPGTSTIEVSLEPSLLSDKTGCVLPAGLPRTPRRPLSGAVVESHGRGVLPGCSSREFLTDRWFGGCKGLPGR